MDFISTSNKDVGSNPSGAAQPDTSTEVSSPTREQIERWLIDRIATLTASDIQEISPDRPFADFALDSALVISVTNEMSRWLGRDLSVTLFWEYPTIEDLAKRLVSA